jgi:hypothetical protein
MLTGTAGAAEGLAATSDQERRRGLRWAGGRQPTGPRGSGRWMRGCEERRWSTQETDAPASYSNLEQKRTRLRVAPSVLLRLGGPWPVR